MSDESWEEMRQLIISFMAEQRERNHLLAKRVADLEIADAMLVRQEINVVTDDSRRPHAIGVHLGGESERGFSGLER